MQTGSRSARSIKPEIDVRTAYLANSGEALGFGDPTSAKTFAKAFIDVFQPDVVLPLAGSGSRGIIEAACEAGILAVGTDYDVATASPELAECILTSVTKDIELAVREAIFSFANGTRASEWRLGLADGGVGVTDEWTRIPGLPVDLNERYSQAEQADPHGPGRHLLDGVCRPCSTDRPGSANRARAAGAGPLAGGVGAGIPAPIPSRRRRSPSAAANPVPRRDVRRRDPSAAAIPSLAAITSLIRRGNVRHVLIDTAVGEGLAAAGPMPGHAHGRPDRKLASSSRDPQLVRFESPIPWANRRHESPPR